MNMEEIKATILFKKIRKILGKDGLQRGYYLIILSITTSVIEVVGLSAIMPFIDIASDFERIQNNHYYQKVFDIFSFESGLTFSIFLGVSLFAFLLFRGGVNFFYNYRMVSFSQELHADLSKKLFNTYLLLPYNKFVSKNSSYLNKVILTEVNLLSAVFSKSLLVVSEFFVILFLYAMMLFVNWEVTLIFTSIFTIKVYFLVKTISVKIKVAGKERSNSQEKNYEILNKAFSNFKQIKLQNDTQLGVLRNEFSLSMDKYRCSEIKNGTLTAVPRIFLETMGFGVIILSLVFLLYLNQTNIMFILPSLSFFVLAMYRILPSINRIINAVNSIIYHYRSLEIISKELDTPPENLENNPIFFEKSIKLTNVSFSFNESHMLSNINLEISKGDKVAIIGKSGSGKSTLIDLITGLYNPKEGEILIDNVLLNRFNIKQWRSKIGYIPQQVYLFDGTVSANVCFGREVNERQLLKVLKLARIFPYLEARKGVNTLVGEGGIKLSGGQKQRIAIARALYGNPEILILDEATSALDSKTEEDIMKEIYQLSDNKTLIIVTHRLSTTTGCNKIYRLDDETPSVS